MKIKCHLPITSGVFLFILVVSAAVLFPVSDALVDHPALLFHDISETPGYKFSSVQPWKSYQQQIINSANTALKKDFGGNLGAYDRVFYRADYARDCAFAYQITKNPDYAKKAKEALLLLDYGTVTGKTDSALALGSYAVAYDLTQPSLDPQSDGIIRDKLALLADSVYQGLNDGGKNRNYVSFADYHGQAYPMVGIAGAVLTDFSNPNQLTLSSTPQDWQKVGTDYLFIDDKLHSYGRSLFSFGFDETSGKHLNGAYKAYVIDDFAWWLQIYNHVYQTNPFEKYPAAKRAFTSEIWESLPNGYGNDFVTSGNLKWTYHRYFVNLLNDQEKAVVLNFDEKLEGSNILPYSSSIGGQVPAGLLYSTYGNYDSIERHYPTTDTSHLMDNAVYQVFRKSWEPDSDWLSIVTWNTTSNSNRDMYHGDQTGIEYYSHGDLLLADAGENKYVLDKLYGEYEIHHNTIAIADPRSPFPPSPWSGTEVRGIVKGNSNGLITPAAIYAVLSTPWIEFIDTHMTITQVFGDSYGDMRKLSSPVTYSRSILFPDSEYFIVIDRLDGTEPWKYSTIFRPSSLSITPTILPTAQGTGDISIGSVQGDMSVGGTRFDWKSLPFKTETYTGKVTPFLSWNTENPYGREVEMDLSSYPASGISVNKLVGRVAGYQSKSEVYTPVVRFEAPVSEDMYRITTLISRYQEEEIRSVSEIPVTGQGTAIRIHSVQADDIVYAGTGVSRFNQYTTDADVVFIRSSGDRTEITLFGGSYLNSGAECWVSIPARVEYLTVRKTGGSINYKMGNAADLNPVLFSQNPDQKPMVPGSIVTNPSPQTSNISDVSAEPGTLEPGMQTSSANDVILGYIRGIIQVYHNLLKLT